MSLVRHQSNDHRQHASGKRGSKEMIALLGGLTDGGCQSSHLFFFLREHVMFRQKLAVPCVPFQAVNVETVLHCDDYTKATSDNV